MFGFFNQTTTLKREIAELEHQLASARRELRDLTNSVASFKIDSAWQKTRADSAEADLKRLASQVSAEHLPLWFRKDALNREFEGAVVSVESTLEIQARARQLGLWPDSEKPDIHDLEGAQWLAGKMHEEGMRGGAAENKKSS